MIELCPTFLTGLRLISAISCVERKCVYIFIVLELLGARNSRSSLPLRCQRARNGCSSLPGPPNRSKWPLGLALVPPEPSKWLPGCHQTVRNGRSSTLFENVGRVGCRFAKPFEKVVQSCSRGTSALEEAALAALSWSVLGVAFEIVV